MEEQTREAVREERSNLFRRLAWYRRRIEALETQTVLDDLTGLRNHRALWRELTRRGETTSTEDPISLVMLDFDMFNAVNERYGHAIGDAVLRRCAAVLRDAAPTPRLAFRYGGEEFVVLVPGDEEDARMLAEEVRVQISGLNGRLPAVTVSCGVAQFDEPVEPWIALDRADAALQAAKRTGRNRVVVSGRPQPTGNPYLVEELEQETARRAALALAMATLGERDPDTADHSEDVLALCESVGRRLGLGATELEHLMTGAQLHDVGKVAVPSQILNKPGPLTDDEWSVIREHTIIGERILRSVPEMAEVATIVRHSHEHWDGQGYPDGLVGDRIPLASRIILCADAFHAIRSNRPYRSGQPADEAFAELRRCSGTQFDPTVVAALLDVAEDLRKQKAGGTVGAALPRNRRVVALLAALVIGTTSAVAGIPELRDAVKSIFGAGTAPAPAPVVPGAATLNPDATFGFGPLGETLSIAPTRTGKRGDREVVPRSQAVRRRGGSTGAHERTAGAVNIFGGADDGAEELIPRPRAPQSTAAPQRAPDATQSPASTQTSAPEPGSAVETGNGGGSGDVKRAPVRTEENGNGRALGKSLPAPRPPAEQPSQNRPPEGGRPDPPGRTDPPAIGRDKGPASPNAHGNRVSGEPKAP